MGHLNLDAVLSTYDPEQGRLRSSAVVFFSVGRMIHMESIP